MAEKYVAKLAKEKPTTPGLYLQLFHGRKTPDEQLDDWGNNGPFIGPLLWCHITYCSTISICAEDDDLGCGTGPMQTGDELYFSDGMLFYDGVYYGDWTLEVHNKTLPPIGSPIKVRADGVVINGTVTGYSEKDGKPIVDYFGPHMLSTGRLSISSTRWAWFEQIVD